MKNMRAPGLRVNRHRGMTLVELMISTSVLSLIGLSVSGLFYASSRATVSQMKQVSFERDSRAFLNDMRSIIHGSQSIDLSVNGLDLTIVDAAGETHRLTVFEDELRHYEGSTALTYETPITNLSPDSWIETEDLASGLQQVRFYLGIRDPLERDGMNYFYMDTTIVSRVPRVVS